MTASFSGSGARNVQAIKPLTLYLKEFSMDVAGLLTDGEMRERTRSVFTQRRVA